jgi:hypothetical protein
LGHSHRVMVHSELPISVLFYDQGGAHLFAMTNGLSGMSLHETQHRNGKIADTEIGVQQWPT